MSLDEVIEKQIVKRESHVKRAESLKRRNSPKFNEFGYGYEVGWLRALRTFKGWIKEYIE